MTPRLVPISELIHSSFGWIIKGRVTQMQDLHHYEKPYRGKVFNFDLLDFDGGEIRLICFNAVADKFYSQILPGKIYKITGGTIRLANKEYNHLEHDFEILLKTTSRVELCRQDDGTIPMQKFVFRSISDVGGMVENVVVDIIGVVINVGLADREMIKDSEILKSSLCMIDVFGHNVVFNLWGDFFKDHGQKLQDLHDSGEFPILAVKSGRVSKFNEKELNTIKSTVLYINPVSEEANSVKEWFESEGKNITSVSIARGNKIDRKSISQIRDEKLGTSHKPDWITVVATIAHIKLDTYCYTACPIMKGSLQCNRKVTDNGDGKWWCDKCDRLVDEYDYKYALQLQIQDHTGITWVMACQEYGEQIMGISAKDLHILKCEVQNKEKFQEAMHRVMYKKFTFTLKVKEETFNAERQAKSTVMKVQKVNFPAEGSYLLGLIPKTGANDSRPSTSEVETNTSAIQSGQDGNQDSGHGFREAESNLASHSSTICPAVMNASGNSNSVSSRASVLLTADECYNCHYIGHRAQDCPRKVKTNTPTALSGGQHSSANCPSATNDLVNTSRVSSGASVLLTADECYNCHYIGHRAQDCPRKVKTNTPTALSGGQHSSANCPSATNDLVNTSRVSSGASVLLTADECYNCHYIGHRAQDCPRKVKTNTPTALSGGQHSSANCPSATNDLVNTSRVSSGASVLLTADECYNCHYIGHRAQDCPRKVKTNTPTALSGGQHSSANCPSATNDLVNTSRVSSGASVLLTAHECYNCHYIGHRAQDYPRKVKTNTPTALSGGQHSSANCPSATNDLVNTSRVSSGASVLLTADECYNCHYIGHRAQDCPRKVKTNTPTALSGGQHSSANCPSATNDLVNTSRVSFGASVVRASDECYKCHDIGHWARDCTRPAPFYGNYCVLFKKRKDV